MCKYFAVKNSFTYMAAILCLAFCCLSCSRERYVSIQGYAQGGTYRIVCLMYPADARELKDGIDSILNVIDNAVSGYNKESLLSRLNRGETVCNDGGAGFAVLTDLTNVCDSLYLATDGVVDTRAAALFDIWGFGFKNEQMPSDSLVQASLKDRGRMNFNAVAQGYSCDLLARHLENKGIRNYLIDVGGEMCCNGLNPKGKGWTIGIDAPVDGNDRPGETLEGAFSIPAGARLGIVTSGNYRKFYVKDGVKYSHTIDPRTGYPLSHNLLSATVVGPNATIADALATYCMVVGMEEAREFIEERPDLEACLISSDGLWCSPGLELFSANQ